MRESKVARNSLVKGITNRQDQLLDIASRLIRSRSENPPGDTNAIAKMIADILKNIDGAEVDFHTAEYPIVNLVARLKGNQPGRRLIFNGHLDTYPIGDLSLWSVDPLGAVQKDGRLYGRGAADMKGGIACSLFAFMLLAEYRDSWKGEVVLTLAGDEETMGQRGTHYLLETVPHALGDAMICGDAGSPMVLRFGEKGMIWLDVMAEGRAAHGAHVHLGINAIERLTRALAELTKLRRTHVATPPKVDRAIRESGHISEKLSGAGEADVLKSVTVNFGLINGGLATNLVAERARASLDIRLPVGVSVAEIETRISEIIEPLEGVTYRVNRRYEPSWTDPDHEIVRIARHNCRVALGQDPVVNMRVGASDARIYRIYKVPSIVCGLTPNNLGGPDEFITVEDLFSVGHIHTMTAFDFLS